MNAAALLLGISVERLELLIDAEKQLSVVVHEKRQIADMYSKLLIQCEKLEEELNQYKPHD
jgi:hypothetical protein